MKTIILIRHGMTEGNRARRFIGCRTDQPLCQEGADALSSMKYPEADILFCSPMKRCLQTAGLIYPGMKPVVVNGLRECDFGDFEGKNNDELTGDPLYQQWIDSGATIPFPGGESPEAFKDRCCAAFVECTGSYGFTSAALVVHGGTIMAIMERFTLPRRNYYEYAVGNGHGYVASLHENRLISFKEI